MKARITFREATHLQAAGHCDGAASRCYYALEQDLIPSYERYFVLPSKLISSLKMPRREGIDKLKKWPHDAMVAACSQFVGSINFKHVQKALALRVIADYRPDKVDPGELQVITDAVPGIFRWLKVPDETV